VYSFARKPIWLAGHALAGVLLVIFVIAGFWQLSRHNEVRDRNAAITERQDLQALNADRFFDTVSDPQLRADVEYRTVTLPVARFDWHEAVQIRNRSLNGVPGCHIAVPVAPDATMTVSDGGGAMGSAPDATGVLVVVGWLPTGGACEDAIATGAEAFRGGLSDTGRLTGRIRLPQQRGLLGPADPAAGQLDSLARTDVQRIDQQTTLDLVPVYVELTAATRVDATPVRLGDNGSGTGLTALLRPLPSPELDAGPHLGYTFQWFSFAAVAIVGYALVLRHQARKGESEQIADD
jgi:cytochrome oxidase assembly protein ShyY1